ncbi:hypothetical protein D1007_04465 [Hordeum vulgare]|nr:hypothetical protein D1007_04465 [Hordeum vulgare]
MRRGVARGWLARRSQTWAAVAGPWVAAPEIKTAKGARGEGDTGPGEMFSYAGVALRPLQELPLHRATVAARRSPVAGPRRYLGDGRGGERPFEGTAAAPTAPAAPPSSAPSAGTDAQESLGNRGVTDTALGSIGEDPVEDFLKSASKQSIASATVDSMAADVQAAAEAAISSPLEFDAALLLNDPNEAVQLDAFSPTLSAAASDLGQYNRATPTPACTMQLQLGAVTGRVSKLQPSTANTDQQEIQGLFRASKKPLIAATPAPASVRRPATPPKTRASSTPTRHSARQAASSSKVPVAQRASLRLVKELGLLGPRDKMTDEAARALLQRFDEPLSDNDLAVIAKLTRLDSDALRIMATMIGPEGAADEAIV